jgi:hypothetical protein
MMVVFAERSLTSIMAAPGRIQFFEGQASERDTASVEAILNNAELQKAAQQPKPQFSVTETNGKIVSIEFFDSGKYRLAQFVDRKGLQSPPAYMGSALDFAKSVKKRNMPKLTGKPERLCLPLHSR